ncbi:MAG: type II restriction endonuclease [Pedobacter sp.]|uniref:type II restriction endonuclease n=1 Tax=Pedobacter sp. TaxID=1411316 RepID=UPI0028091676|nr:type II restriction endonuclease [Pedobacter sp.]MDQ8005267.1 type II restriction endonuclease [Pedobacter sp.]
MSTKLSDYFVGIAAKRLSHVEIFSNQHELNGITKFRSILGEEKANFNGLAVYLPDEEEHVVENESSYTWYDVRANNPNRSAEYRLYFSDNEVVPNAAVGDLVILGKDTQGKLIIIVSPSGSTSEKQLLFLFGLEEVGNSFIVKDFREDKNDIGFAGRYILSTLGIQITEDNLEEDYLAQMVKVFGMTFPTTRDFSAFSRATVKDVSAVEDPDGALVAWWDREGMLLRLFEKEIIKQRLAQGFGEDGTDVDEFLKFSISVINRRKSRAGHSFENHLDTIFTAQKLQYTKGGKTENNNKPDFLFPSVEKYHDPNFNTQLLTMLGVKTTLKDRWRQVLAEANRIPNKHLITLEPAISKNQTDQIHAVNLQLVLPQKLKETFSAEQQQQIINLSDFIDLIKGKSAFMA